MGYTLPSPFEFPNSNRTGCVAVGALMLVSGHGQNLPPLPGVRATGKLGLDVSIEEGSATARAVALSLLSTLKLNVGTLDRIKRVVRLFGMVNVSRTEYRRVGTD